MNIFHKLESQYNEIDQTFSSLEFDAASRGWSAKELRFKEKRDINDQAYFVFMFSRLEGRIKRESLKVIQRKQSGITSWKTRSAWDILPGSTTKSLEFKKCLALLCKKGASTYNQVSAYYDERNSVAHGGTFQSAISMPNVILNLKNWYKELSA